MLAFVKASENEFAPVSERKLSFDAVTEPNPILDPFKCPSYTLEDNKCTPTEDNLNYYPIDKHEAQRQAVIGGGKVLGGGDPKVYN